MKRGLYTMDTENRYSYIGMIPSTSGSTTTSQIFYTSSVKVGKTFYNIPNPHHTHANQESSPPMGPDSWPCTASVLETPERRKWKDSNGGRLSVDSGLEVSDSLHSPPFQPDAYQSIQNEFESPLLKTPSTRFRSAHSNSHIHISASPMRSFYIKTNMDSPIKRLPMASTPLKLSNPEKAIGVRFTGEELAMTSTPKPLATIQAKVPNRLLELPPPKNDFIMPEKSRRSSMASSSDTSIEMARRDGRDSMLNISNDVDMMVMIETPSKSLRNNPDDSSGYGLTDLSPIPRSSPLKGRLSVVPLADGFIPEQPSAILDSNIFDMLDPLNENHISRRSIVQNENLNRNERKQPAIAHDQMMLQRNSPLEMEQFSEDSVQPNHTTKQNVAKTNEKQFKLFAGFTQKWIKTVTGQSKDQMDVTKQAHAYTNKNRQQS